VVDERVALLDAAARLSLQPGDYVVAATAAAGVGPSRICLSNLTRITLVGWPVVGATDRSR
jgi:hypothetical protein